MGGRKARGRGGDGVSLSWKACLRFVRLDRRIGSRKSLEENEE